MARKRFTKEERAFLTPGARVEWNNHGHWHPATITTAELQVSDGGWQTMLATNHATTRTLHNGQTISVSPGKVRPAAPPRTVLDGFREAGARYATRHPFRASTVTPGHCAEYGGTPGGVQHSANTFQCRYCGQVVDATTTEMCRESPDSVLYHREWTPTVTTN